ncbi:MAG: hypothetical protein JOZ53_27155, partial [Planctomycetaceae bacterium]|nr:hypothetical protein [Planctomycetaceae bacterium]
VGRGALASARHWEGDHRPYAFRALPLDDEAAEVRWDLLQQGPALLLMHGTFSKARSTFGQLPPDVLGKLAAGYGGRVFAFDHPTLHHSPQENIQTFFQRLPEGVTLELDLLTHSRGGLVGRELIERQADYTGTGWKVRVRQSVFVAAPNLGTILTDADHGLDLLDRYTNLLTDLPDDAFTLTIEGVLALAKVLAHGALTGLPGLRSMLPGGDYLRRINIRSNHSTEYYAVASEFVPSSPGLLARFGSLVAGHFLYSIFGEQNDGVVPTRGCYESGPGASTFAIPTDHQLIFRGGDQVHHCNYFEKEGLHDKLLDWLTL